MRRLALAALLLVGCKTPEGASGQGGAQFNQTVTAPGLPAGELFGICWPADATPQQHITLATLASGKMVFEASGGASNSTGRCLVEVASSYPDKEAVEVEVVPPVHRPSGWAGLEYVRLLAATRFGPERGVLDPAPLVRACISKGDGLRAGSRFQISFDPDVKVRLESLDGAPMTPITGSERCVDAVLNATAWPGTRPLTLELDSATGGAGPVEMYFGFDGAQGALDPVKVKEGMSSRAPAVAQCWDQALARHAGLGGGRSIRLRVDDTGAVTQVAVAGNVSAEPITAADYLLDQCLIGVTRTAHFPAGSAGDAVYSWVFARRG